MKTQGGLSDVSRLRNSELVVTCVVAVLLVVSALPAQRASAVDSTPAPSPIVGVGDLLGQAKPGNQEWISPHMRIESDGNETEFNESGETGNELGYPGFSFGSVPNGSYIEPPAVAPGPLFIRLKSTGEFNPLQTIPNVPHNLFTVYNITDRGHYIIQYTGTPRESWMNQTENHAGSFLGYLQDYAYLISLDVINSTVMASEPFTRWLGVYHAGYKLDPSVQMLLPDIIINVTVIAYPGTNMSALRGNLTSLNETILVEGSDYFIVSMSSSSLDSTAYVEDVQWIEAFTEPALDLDVSTGIVHARQQPNGAWIDDGNSAWNYNAGNTRFEGITGAGVTVAVADTGLDTPNNDFNNRFDAFIDYSAQGYNDQYGHGTHVAGIITGDAANDAANGRRFVGVAPAAHLVVQKIFGQSAPCNANQDNVQFMNVGVERFISEAAYLGAYVSSNSWGGGLWGAYNDFARAYDGGVIDALPQVSGNQPVTFVFAAGNEGPGWGRVMSPGVGKNVITVGASENNKPTLNHFPPETPRDSNDPNQVAGFSSLGPTNDGRVKPDLVAPGTYILSAESAQIPALCRFRIRDAAGTGPNYIYQSGTSMATPHVSGAAAVIVQYYRDRYGFTPSPAFIKAALINGADDMGYGYGQGNNFVLGDGTILAAGFGYNIQGWGRLNLPNSLYSTSTRTIWFDDQQQYSVVNGGGGPITAAGQSRQYYVYADGTVPLKITLVWTDPTNQAVGAQRTLVNDLDLTVTSPNGVTTYLGNQFGVGAANHFSVPGGARDGVNNVENVFINNPAPGRWTITVNAQAITAPASSPQQSYALVVSFHRIPIDDFRYVDSPMNHGWWEYDHANDGNLQTVFDPTLNSQVMQTTTNLPDQTQYGIALTGTQNVWAADLGLRGNFLSAWFRDTNYFYFFARTWGLCLVPYPPFISLQQFVLTYYPSAGLPNQAGNYLNYPIGTRYMDGSWHLIQRDLARDLLAVTGCLFIGTVAFYLRGNFFIDDLDIRDTNTLMGQQTPTRGWGMVSGPVMSGNLELTNHLAYSRLGFRVGVTVYDRFMVRNTGTTSISLLYVYVDSRPNGQFRDFGYSGPVTLQSGESMTFLVSRAIDIEADWPFTPGYSTGTCVGCPGQTWTLWNARVRANTQDWDRDAIVNSQEWRWDAGVAQWRRLDPWRSDTDLDGVTDNTDIEPSANIRMLVGLSAVSVQDDVDLGCGNPWSADPYWRITINGVRITTMVRWNFICIADGTLQLRIYYTLDVPDNLNSLSILVEAWERSTLFDWHYDINPTVGVRDYSTTWNVPGSLFQGTGTGGTEYPRQVLSIVMNDSSDGAELYYTPIDFNANNRYELFFQ